MECGFIETTDRGLQCEFNNIFMFNTTEVLIIETNNSIDAVSFRQSELYTVPADIFRVFINLKHLDIELTQMKNISADNFVNAKSLKYFMARFNDIESLERGTFVSCAALKFIILQYNRISQIDSEAFEGLENLEALYLDYNRMLTIPANMLNPLTNLLHFSMAYNNLTSIPDDLFMRNERLETFNLGHNLLKYFNNEQFEKLPNLERIQLDHNKLKKLDLSFCKSTEINVDKNQLQSLEINKWTRFVSAWGNNIERLTLHEQYGTGRSYNFSFNVIEEITLFVNENCCNEEHLENFKILILSFGDLSQKNLNVSDWSCKYLKTIGYETPNGLIVNNVCRKLSSQLLISTTPESFYAVSEFKLEEEKPTTELHTPPPTPTTVKQRVHIFNSEDYIESDEISTKPRESMEDTSPLSIFTGMDIETLPEKKTTTLDPFSYTAHVEEIFPGPTTESYDKKCEKGIFKTIKKKAKGWRDTLVKKWSDWTG